MKYEPANSLVNATTVVFELRPWTNHMNYMFHGALMHLRIRLCKPDGSKLDDDVLVAPV